MKYRPDIDEVIHRYQVFYQSDEPGSILIHVFVPPAGSVPYDLREYAFPDLNENARYLKAFIANRKCFLNGRLGVKDDYVPDVYQHHGIGIHSAYIAGSPVMGEDTSWVEPVIKNWEDMGKLELSEENPWFRVMQQTAQILADELAGEAAIPTFYHYSPLDLANALRGNQLFLDFTDAPGEVRRLLDFCTKAVIWLEEKLWQVTGDFHGGAPLWGSWLPGHSLMMSEDVANLCRTGYYPDWAAPWTQKAIDHFKGALIHNHSKGLHMQHQIAGLQNLKVLQITEDPNQPRPFDHMQKILAAARGVPVQFYVRPEEIPQAVELARGGKAILQTNASDAASANEIVHYVREHSTIKVG